MSQLTDILDYCFQNCRIDLPCKVHGPSDAKVSTLTRYRLYLVRATLTDVAQIHFTGSLFPYCIKPSVTLTSLSAWLGLDLTNIILTDKLYLLTNFSNELRRVQMSISVEAFVCILAFYERKSDLYPMSTCRLCSIYWIYSIDSTQSIHIICR